MDASNIAFSICCIFVLTLLSTIVSLKLFVKEFTIDQYIVTNCIILFFSTIVSLIYSSSTEYNYNKKELSLPHEYEVYDYINQKLGFEKREENNVVTQEDLKNLLKKYDKLVISNTMKP
jgi:hypothetical protein